MTQKMVLIEAFNDNVFDFNNANTHIDLGGLLGMATTAKTNPNRIEFKMDIAADHFSLRMSRDDFLKSKDNITLALKTAFELADKNAGPQVVAGTNTWQVSVITPIPAWGPVIGGCSHG